MVYTGGSEAWGAYFIYALLYYQKQEQEISCSFTMHEFDYRNQCDYFALIILLSIKLDISREEEQG